MKIRISRTQLLLTAIIIGAATLRLQLIDQPFVDQYGWRETSTAMMADNFWRRNWNILYPEISWNGPGPSYNGREFQTVSYIAALLYSMVGQHNWVGRSVAVLFGLWGIFALYQLTRQVWDQKHGLMAAAVMALIPGSIFTDREFLPDPAMVALITTGCWLLVRYCKHERFFDLWLAIVISAWGFLTKLTGLVVGIPMLYASFTILRQKQRLNYRMVVTSAIAALLTLIPVVAYYLWARYLYLNYPPHHFAGAGSWLWDQGFMTWINERYYLPKLYRHFDGWIWTKPVLGLVCLGLVLPPPQQLSNSNPDPEAFWGKAPWFFHWWIVGVGVYYFIGCKHLVDQPYNFHLANPAAAALSGHAILSIASLFRRRSQTPVVLACILTILLVIGLFGHRRLPSVYRPVLEPSYRLGIELQKLAEPDDLVVSIADEIGNPVMIYYSHRRGWIFPPAWSEIPWWDDLAAGQDQDLISLLEELHNQGSDWIGIVTSQYEKLRASNSKFIEYIEQNFELKYSGDAGLIYRIS
ncbi:glycosyltransferase family 39 protein [Leptolyngbya sp. FACHB-711]|uniref:ArnT family glycosyltransferase n=1 Tax=Leptolyngbya sp. FACHB-711 TaxID=2692813 RepID=UPI001684995D|nr:glycosyltransferase family 39 protein [Leptolyngbya sp. FACHB-711]MBD2028341.1 glycosyltransferase family 39 protein [Leptolyngbya sp. FACHB-711]